MDLFDLRPSPSLLLTLSFALPVVLGTVLSVFFGSQSKKREARYFSIMLFFVVLWVAGNGISLLSKSVEDVQLIDTLFTLTSSYVPPFYLLFARSLGEKKNSLKLHIALLAIAVINHAVLVVHYSNFLEVMIIEDGLNTFKIVYPLGLLFALYYVAFFGFGSLELYRAYKNSSKQKRNKLKVGVASLIAATSIAAVTNTVGLGLVTIQSAAASSLISLCAIVGLSYSVLRLEFLDVKPKVVRFFAYIVVFGVFMSLYLAAGLVISRSLEGVVSPFITQVLYFAVALLLALSYSTLKRFFNKVTDTIFYQDAYSEQEVVANVNHIILGETQLEPLVSKSVAVLDGAIRPESLSYASITELKKYPGLKANEETYVFAENTQSKRLKQALIKDGVVMTKRLYTNNKTTGYLLFGEKKSGRQYSEADLTMVNNVSSSLAVAIQNAQNFEEIKQFSEKLQSEVAEATQELNAANKELRSLDKAKDEFFSLASHQLKSPLTATSQAIYLLQQPSIKNDSVAQIEIMQIAEESSKRSTALVRDMFSIAQLTTGSIVLKKTEANITELLELRIKIAQVLADQKNQTVKLTLPPSTISAKVDEDKIKEVVSNYLENAIKYSPEQSIITVHAKQSKASITVTVVDQGIGIPKKEQAKLFTKFYRASNAISSREGTGLGLYLAKHIIELHRGKITLSSTENKGSSFGFTLPKK